MKTVRRSARAMAPERPMDGGEAALTCMTAKSSWTGRRAGEKRTSNDPTETLDRSNPDAAASGFFFKRMVPSSMKAPSRPTKKDLDCSRSCELLLTRQPSQRPAPCQGCALSRYGQLPCTRASGTGHPSRSCGRSTRRGVLRSVPCAGRPQRPR